MNRKGTVRVRASSPGSSMMEWNFDLLRKQPPFSLE